MNEHSLLMHTASHLFVKNVSCRSAKFTTGDFECMLRLKKFKLQKGQNIVIYFFQEMVNSGYLHFVYSAFVRAT